MKIYTRSGDQGKTSLFGGRRVSKSIVRLEAIGCVDEANSYVGLIISKLETLNTNSTKQNWISNLIEQLENIQSRLLQIGADLATSYAASTSLQKSIDRLTPKLTKQLETEIDEMEKKLKPLKYFILPGGHEIAGLLQITRSIVRRAERNTVRLEKGAKVNPNVLKYLNRLSDWLFVAARFVNYKLDGEEKPWR